MDRPRARPPLAERSIVLDMDSSESPTYGEQEGTAYNGHFGCTCYHPLFVFNQFGDLERCALRPGNVHSADGWRDVLEPVVARYRAQPQAPLLPRRCRLRQPRGLRVPRSRGLRLRDPAAGQPRLAGAGSATCSSARSGDRRIEVRRYYASFSYQAQSWNKPRRVVAKVEWHPGELYPRVGFIVTNLSRPAERVVAFYNQRGTCEQ